MMKKRTQNRLKKQLLPLFLLMSFVFYAQKTTRADRFFNNGDYLNAAKYYEIQLENKYAKKAIQNIATSYYNIFEYRDAAYFLKELVNGNFNEDDKTYDNKYNFMLFQVQAALGNYENGLDYLQKYNQNLNLPFNKKENVALIEEIRLKNPDYTIKKTHYNSIYSDFGAVKKGDVVYFTSDRGKELLKKEYKWTHQSFLNIYSVKVNSELDTVSSIVKLTESINSKLHEGNFCFSKDGNTIYVSKSNSVKGKKVFDKQKNNNIHLYKAIKVAGKWSKLEKLPFNALGYSYQHPALNPKEDKLYFSSNREGGFGEYDLYYVTIKDTIYGEPVNLGATINTSHREHFPFISKKGNLFFSSNGHLGLGMLDNFVSEKIKGEFTEPINLGVPINSKYDDFNVNYFNDKQGFFASNRNQKQDDIFSFTQIGEIFIREYINTFEIRDYDTKAFISNVTVSLLNKKNKEIYNNTLDSDAVFNVNILPSYYRLKATCKGYKENENVFKVLEKQNQKHILYLHKIPAKIIPSPLPPKPIDPIVKVMKEKGINKDLKEKDPKRFELLTDVKGPPIVERNGKLYFEMPPIYFDFDMWNIREDSRLILNELAKKLDRYPNIYLKINSYTDSRGTKMYNQVLSERRAESTRNYLALETYINARRFKFEGFGETHPIIPCEIPSNCTEDEHQLNRRSEFEIIKY